MADIVNIYNRHVYHYNRKNNKNNVYFMDFGPEA